MLPLTLLESAELLGRYRYVELTAFASLGRRATTCASPGVAAYLAGASLAHGWRAGLLEERLPVSVAQLDATTCTVAPSPELEQAIELVVAPGEDADVLDGLIGALYPAMTAGYAERLAACSRAADPPIRRLLGRLLADIDAVRQEGAELAGQLDWPTSGRRRSVEELLGRGGGAFGSLYR